MQSDPNDSNLRDACRVIDKYILFGDRRLQNIWEQSSNIRKERLDDQQRTLLKRFIYTFNELKNGYAFCSATNINAIKNNILLLAKGDSSLFKNFTDIHNLINNELDQFINATNVICNATTLFANTSYINSSLNSLNNANNNTLLLEGVDSLTSKGGLTCEYFSLRAEEEGENIWEDIVNPGQDTTPNQLTNQFKDFLDKYQYVNLKNAIDDLKSKLNQNPDLSNHPQLPLISLIEQHQSKSVKAINEVNQKVQQFFGAIDRVYVQGTHQSFSHLRSLSGDYYTQYLIFGSALMIVCMVVFGLLAIVMIATAVAVKIIPKDGLICCFIFIHFVFGIIIALFGIVIAIITIPLMDLGIDFFGKNLNQAQKIGLGEDNIQLFSPLVEELFTLMDYNYIGVPEYILEKNNKTLSDNKFSPPSYRLFSFDELDQNAALKFYFRNSEDLTQLPSPFDPIFSKATDTLITILNNILDPNKYFIDSLNSSTTNAFFNQFENDKNAVQEAMDIMVSNITSELNSPNVRDQIQDLAFPFFTSISSCAASSWAFSIGILLIASVGECLLICGRYSWMHEKSAMELRAETERLEWRKKKYIIGDDGVKETIKSLAKDKDK